MKQEGKRAGSTFGGRLRWRATLHPWLTTAAFLVAMLAARASLADHYRVPTGSMLPTVREGDHLLVDKLAYGFRLPWSHVYLAESDGPARGDVVVFDSPEDGEVLLKRVAAVPGDRVEVRAGRLIVNGRPIPVESRHGRVYERFDGAEHELDLSRGGGPDWGPTVIPPERYLLLGDNRGNSRDGRIFGLVQRSAILGRALGVFLRDGSPTWQPL